MVNDSDPARLTLSASAADNQLALIHIQQMDCPTEAELIRKKLGTMPEVNTLEFNLLRRTLAVSHTPNALDSILQALRSLGFTPRLNGEQQPAPRSGRTPTRLLGSAALCALGAELAAWFDLPTAVSALPALLAVAICGLGTYKKGWIALRNFNLNINALMSIAVTGALALGQWSEAAMVMVLYQIAELLEEKSLDRARNAMQGLLKLAPEQALVQQADGSWQLMAADQVAPGARLRVRPGERIALDGEILSGHSSIDQSAITGESLPVDKGPGNQVLAGTINGAGSFDYQATAAASDSSLARIIKVMEQAQDAQAPSQRLVDRFARVYTPAVVLIALAVALLPTLIGDQPWLPWIYKALVLLVIACPCALVIATPVSIVSALTAAARQGILIKGGAYLEQARKLSCLVLDKTGTLTLGKPHLVSYQSLADRPELDCLSLAASLAEHSDHPISQAIYQAASVQSVDLQPISQLQAQPGRGISGHIDNQIYWLANRRQVKELGLDSPILDERFDKLQQQGLTLSLLMSEQQVLAVFAVADSIKPGSRQAIAELKRLGLDCVLLSGDSPQSTAKVAGELGIDQALGNQLPEDKLHAVERYAQQGKVAMVGDGINDAPALARANIGIAMGVMGSDTAIETADVALMDDDLSKIGRFIRLSRRTHDILMGNLGLAIGIKVVFLLLTLAGWGNMWMAVFADVGASLLVVGNGLRLLHTPRAGHPS